jgi:triphosphatase
LNSNTSEPAAPTIEVEHKLGVPDLQRAQAWFNEPSLNGYSFAPAREVRQTDTYLDSEDWRIYRLGYACRVRQIGRGRELMLKSLGGNKGGAWNREEVSQPLPGNWTPGQDLPEGAVAAKLAALLSGGKLRPLFSLRNQRRRLIAAPEAGAGTAEVTLDLVRLQINGRRSAAEFAEIEVELLEAGDPGLIDGIARGLTVDLAGEASSQSKFERGLEAAGLDPRQFTSFGSTELRDDLTARQAVAAILRKQAERVVAEEPAVRIGDDPEALHDMRVATRRARTFLRIYSDVLPLGRVTRISQELRWLGDSLGEVRDLDVQVEALAVADGGDDPRSLARRLYRDYLESHRAEKRGRLIRDLDSARYARLLRSMRALLRQTRSMGPVQRMPGPDYLKAIAHQRLRTVLRRGRRLSEGSSTDDLHRLRIRTKRARYALEAGSPFVGKAGKAVVSAAVGLQDYLGELQDSVVGAQRLREFAETDSAGDDRRVLVALGGLIQESAGRVEDMRRGFPEAFRRFRKTPELARLMGRLERFTLPEPPALTVDGP